MFLDDMYVIAALLTERASVYDQWKHASSEFMEMVQNYQLSPVWESYKKVVREYMEKGFFANEKIDRSFGGVENSWKEWL